MLRALRLHVISRFNPASERPQILGTPVERARLLVHPERRHHRRMGLLLWRLLLVDRALSVGVLGRDGEPASGLRQHSHDSILAGEFL